MGSGYLAGASCITTNPELVNPTSDFSLQSGSPAIDAGSSNGTACADYIGTSRPQSAGYDIGAYEYQTTAGSSSSAAGTAVVTVTESAGTTYANLPITMTVNNSYMATNGFMQSNGLDAAVVGTGGIALPTMIDSTQTLFVAPVTKSTQNGFNFTTGNTPVTSMPIIVGNSGYVTTADNAAFEPGNNFSIVASGYLDTSSP